MAIKLFRAFLKKWGKNPDGCLSLFGVLLKLAKAVAY